jgi:hypothetical protein
MSQTVAYSRVLCLTPLVLDLSKLRVDMSTTKRAQVSQIILRPNVIKLFMVVIY